MKSGLASPEFHYSEGGGLWLARRNLVESVSAYGVHQRFSFRRLHTAGLDHVHAVLDERGLDQFDTAAIRGQLDPLDGQPGAVQFGRAVGAGVLVAVVFDRVGGWVTACFGRDRLREDNAETARPHMDRLHLEGNLAGKINAE